MKKNLLSKITGYIIIFMIIITFSTSSYAFDTKSLVKQTPSVDIKKLNHLQDQNSLTIVSIEYKNDRIDKRYSCRVWVVVYDQMVEGHGTGDSQKDACDAAYADAMNQLK